jgi:hypothetical protein
MHSRIIKRDKFEGRLKGREISQKHSGPGFEFRADEIQSKNTNRHMARSLKYGMSKPDF